MDVVEEINKILEIKESYKAPERAMDIMFLNKSEREKVFVQFLDLWERDLSKDKFHEYFEFEQADRKIKKQDYTPSCVAELVSRLVGNGSTTYDCCSGTGGLIIDKWYEQRQKSNPFTYKPSDYLYICEELSDRALPFLLINTCIRGMNAIIIQCDVLTREASGAFLIQNVEDDHMKFSHFNVLPYTEEVEKYLNIKFIEQKYEKHIETPRSWIETWMNK